MDDLNDKTTGGTLQAPEWNQVPSELQNIITQSGQSLTGADLDQLGKGIAKYATNGDYYVEAAGSLLNAYVIEAGWGQQQEITLSNGHRVRFLVDPSRTNTGASTLQITGFAAAPIVRQYNLPQSGINPGDMNGWVELEFRGGAWELKSAVEKAWLDGVITGDGMVVDPMSNTQLFDSIVSLATKEADKVKDVSTNYLGSDFTITPADSAHPSSYQKVNDFEFPVVSGKSYSVEMSLSFSTESQPSGGAQLFRHIGVALSDSIGGSLFGQSLFGTGMVYVRELGVDNGGFVLPSLNGYVVSGYDAKQSNNYAGAYVYGTYVPNFTGNTFLSCAYVNEGSRGGNINLLKGSFVRLKEIS